MIYVVQACIRHGISYTFECKIVIVSCCISLLLFARLPPSVHMHRSILALIDISSWINIKNSNSYLCTTYNRSSIDEIAVCMCVCVQYAYFSMIIDSEFEWSTNFNERMASASMRVASCCVCVSLTLYACIVWQMSWCSHISYEWMVNCLVLQFVICYYRQWTNISKWPLHTFTGHRPPFSVFAIHIFYVSSFTCTVMNVTYQPAYCNEFQIVFWFVLYCIFVLKFDIKIRHVNFCDKNLFRSFSRCL